jgi:hypothetical protein
VGTCQYLPITYLKCSRLYLGIGTYLRLYELLDKKLYLLLGIPILSMTNENGNFFQAILLEKWLKAARPFQQRVEFVGTWL